jgi:splicing factor 3A subunit 3
MRCLGIPNSRHFHDITKINDALSLWSKIKKDNTFGQWKPEAEEEFEDKDGNVFNKKTYEDLKRQGLL